MNRLVLIAAIAFLFSFCFVQIKRAESLFGLEIIKTERPFSQAEIMALEERTAQNLSFIQSEAITLKRDGRRISKIAAFTNENYAGLMNLNIIEGRFFSEEDYALSRNICVLEKKTAALWFEGGSAAGEKIEIEGESFLIAGVVENSWYLNEEKWPSIYIPFTSACLRFGETEINCFLAEKDSSAGISFGREEEELTRLNFVQSIISMLAVK